VVYCHYFLPGLRLYLVSVQQMAPHRLRWRTSNCCSLLIYWPWKDERLSWPELTSSWRFTDISGHLSAEGRACDRGSSLAKDWRSTTVKRYQPHWTLVAGISCYISHLFCSLECCHIFVMYLHVIQSLADFASVRLNHWFSHLMLYITVFADLQFFFCIDPLFF